MDNRRSLESGEGCHTEARRNGRAGIGVDLDNRKRVGSVPARDQAPEKRARHVAAADDGDVHVESPRKCLPLFFSLHTSR